MPPYFFQKHGITFPSQPPAPPHHPPIEGIHDGSVKKVPMFYEKYQGPESPGLNLVAATGRVVPGVGFVFTATTQGPIDTSQSPSFIFGVNRGGSKGFGPVPDRANLVSDAAVSVKVTPSGASGQVMLYPTQPVLKETVETKGALSGTGIAPLQPINFYGPTQTPSSTASLPPQDVSIRGNTVTVVVPAGMLPPTSQVPDGLFLTRYGFAASVRLKPNDPTQIASFAPEYNAIPLSIPKSHSPSHRS